MSTATPAIAGPPEAALQLTCRDGGVVGAVGLARPDRYRTLFEPPGEGDAAMPRGAGLSLAATSFRDGGTSWDLRRFDRLLAYDAETGELAVEAGCTLGKVHDFLRGQGRCLAVQAAHPAATLGGCLASEVYGLNPGRDGTFAGQVCSLDLFHPDHGELYLAPDDDPQGLLPLTLGGFGLTGLIVRVRLKTAALGGTSVTTRHQPVPNLAAAADALDQHVEALVLHTVHGLAGEGAGTLVVGEFSAAPSPKPAASMAGLELLEPAAPRPGRPLPAPGTHPPEAAFFPALAGGGSHASFGAGGFHQLELLVPDADWQPFAAALGARLAAHPVGPGSAVCRRFRGEAGLLGFAGAGVACELRFGRGSAGAALAAHLDELAQAHGARPNLAKDSRLPRVVAEATLPGLEDFRRRLRAFDPRRRYQSELSERLGL